MAEHDDVIEIFTGLAETCRDGAQGFRMAAEAMRDGELRRLFESYAEQRAAFADELRSEIERRGGSAPSGGSVAASLHRGWMNIRSVVSGGSQDTIVAEAERGEDAAMRAYESALAHVLAASVRPLVERQYARVREARDRLRTLRDLAA